MDNQNDIEIQGTENLISNNPISLPTNFITIGNIESDDVRIYIKQNVYLELEKYSSADVEHERGTILIGDFCENMGKTSVIICYFIEAKYTDASASTLTFTHETWNYVNKVFEEKYSGKKIIGWQHTHPGYGIFLSNYDIFIHENFFNLPFQIAYVIDPKQNYRGFFQWKNNKIEKLKGFYIYDEVGKKIKIEEKKKPEEKQSKSRSLPKGIYIVIALLFTISALLSVVSFSLGQKYNQQLTNQSKLVKEIDDQKSQMESQSSKIDSLEKAITSGESSSVNDIIDKINNGEIKVSDKKEILEGLKKLSDKNDGNTVKFISYKVKNGDTLYGICENHKLNYSDNINIILSINGITDPNSIIVGQNILLPKL